MATIDKYEVKAGIRYYVRYVKPDGSQGFKRGFRTVEAARFWASEVEVQKHTGSYVDPKHGKTRVGSLADAWLALKEAKLKPSAYRPLASAWKIHVEPKWGQWALADIETTDVEDWITWMVSEIRDPQDAEKVIKKPYSATTVIRAHSVLAGILDRAARDRRIAGNKARAVENLPRKQRRDHVYLSHAQVDAFAAASGERWSTLVYTLAYTGLRWGEVTALRVQDLNLLRRRVNVSRNVVQVGSTWHVGTPKSGKSRTVAVPGFVAELLAAQCVGKSMDDLVFTAPRSGEWIRRPSINTSWFRAAAEACGVVGITPHDLRHTAASLAVQSGANVKVVQAMLGHESAALTLDVYADLFDEDLDTVASAMDAARNASLRELRVTSPDQKLITASKTV